MANNPANKNNSPGKVVSTSDLKAQRCRFVSRPGQSINMGQTKNNTEQRVLPLQLHQWCTVYTIAPMVYMDQSINY